MPRAAQAPGLKTATVTRPVIIQPVIGMVATALVTAEGVVMLREVWVPGILVSDSPGSLVEESTVSLTATKGVQTPGSPISSVTKPAMSYPVGLMLVTVDKIIFMNCIK